MKVIGVTAERNTTKTSNKRNKTKTNNNNNNNNNNKINKQKYLQSNKYYVEKAVVIFISFRHDFGERGFLRDVDAGVFSGYQN